MSARSWIVIGALVLVVAAVLWLLRDVATPPQGSQAVGVPPAANSAPTENSAAATRARQAEAIRPQAFQEVVETSPVRDDRMVVTVVMGDRPVEGAIVAAVDPTVTSLRFSPLPSHSVTGADGSARVRLDAPLEVARILVLARDHLPVLVRLEDPVRQRVTLEDEAMLRGKVLVNGEVPRTPLRLELLRFMDPTAAWSEAIRRFLGKLGFSDTITFNTAADGSFAIYGLTRGDIATIRIPEWHYFADPQLNLNKRERLFDCDGKPILLELRTLNVLTGRIVRPDKPGGTGDLEVRFTLSLPASGRLLAGEVRTQSDGAFRIGLLEPVITSITLDIWEGGFPGRRVGQKRIDQMITGSKDLGDIVLDEAMTVSFLLTDAAGLPVAKGRVLAAGIASQETGPDGRTKIAIPPSTRGVIVGAPQYRIEGVRLPESLPASMDVRLKRASQVVVRVRHENSDESLRGLRVLVSYSLDEATVAAQVPEFADIRGERASGGTGGQFSGSPGPGIYGRASGGNHTGVYEMEPRDIVVSGFKDGDEVLVRVQDRHGHDLLDESVRLADEEVKVMEMVVRSKPRILRGTILDERRRALSSARVQVVAPGSGFGPDFGCDSSGQFEIPDVYGESPVLQVSAPGYVPKGLGGAEVLEAPTIVLEPARQLAVRLTGARSSTQFPTFEITPGGETFTAQMRDEDVYIFEAIPKRPGTVRVQSKKSATSVAVGADDVRVDIPRPE